MNNPSNTDTPLFKTGPSQWVNLGNFLASSIGTVASIYLSFHPIFTLIAVVFGVYKYLEVKTTMFHVREMSLTRQSGIFNVDIYDFPWHRVKSLHINKPLLYRLVGLTNINLVTSDSLNRFVKLKGIPGGDELTSFIKDKVNEARKEQTIREIDLYNTPSFNSVQNLPK
jgi:uncharacterized membrane protein YdbT with pleckstrin-like domain